MDKWILKSKTVWGLIIMSLPLVAQLTGFQLQGDEGAKLQEFFDTAVTLAGMALGLWGRFTATTGIKVL